MPDVEDQPWIDSRVNASSAPERLVHQHELDRRQCAGDTDSLLHPARQLVDRPPGEIPESRRDGSLSSATRCSLRARRRASGSPNATLSTTLSHGISACFWNTTPRSAPGPVTALPSSRMSPSVGGRKPAMHERSVVLPQPDAPIATTKSPSRIVRFTFDNARRSPLEA